MSTDIGRDPSADLSADVGVGADLGADAGAAWRALVATALLGTDRAGGQALALPPPVVAAGQQVGLRLDDASPAALLASAALLDVARAAGTRHEVRGPLPAPEAPDEVLPVARTSRPVVARLLAGPADERHEWLDLVRGRGLVVPHHALPGLLRLALADTGLRASLRDVVGSRGRWLAGLDPALAPLAAAWAEGPSPVDPQEVSDDTWRLGDLNARVRWLLAVRTRDPAAGRDAVAGVLPGLPAAERAELLGALATGLGDDDEDLLERALDDRAAAPRRTAVELLARLPRSAFTTRARDRAAAHVRVARVGLRRRLVLELPERPFDAAALRDGLVEPPRNQAAGGPGGVLGHRALRLHQLLVAAPLDTWVPGLAATPEDLVRLPVTDDREDLVHGALAGAVERAADARWAAALLQVAPKQTHRLVPFLPVPERTRAVTALLRGTPDERALARAVLVGWARPWPDDLTDAVVGAVRRTPVDASYGARATARELTVLLARRADPLTTVVDPGDDPHLQQATATLADRRQIIEETTA